MEVNCSQPVPQQAAGVWLSGEGVWRFRLREAGSHCGHQHLRVGERHCWVWKWSDPLSAVNVISCLHPLVNEQITSLVTWPSSYSWSRFRTDITLPSSVLSAASCWLSDAVKQLVAFRLNETVEGNWSCGDVTLRRLHLLRLQLVSICWATRSKGPVACCLCC